MPDSTHAEQVANFRDMVDNGAKPKSRPEPDPTDWKGEAEFWQLKYFELMIHSNQVITALSRPMLAQQAMAQLQAQAAAAAKAATS